LHLLRSDTPVAPCWNPTPVHCSAQFCRYILPRSRVRVNLVTLASTHDCLGCPHWVRRASTAMQTAVSHRAAPCR
jgi:hypothetical protein